MWQEIVSQAVGVIGSFGTVGVALAAAYRWSARFNKWAKAFLSVPARIATVEREMITNSGSTIKDKITIIETNTEHIARKNEILFKAMGIAEFVADFDGQFIKVSTEFCHLVGRADEDCLGWGWTEFVKMDIEEWRRMIKLRVSVRLRVIVGQKQLVLIAQPLDKTSYYGIITNEDNL